MGKKWGGDLSRTVRAGGPAKKSMRVCGIGMNIHSMQRPASRTNACGAVSLSNDSHVSVGLEKECRVVGFGWFASYSESNSST